MRWFRKAADQGNLKSSYLLAWLSYDHKNYQEAYNNFNQLAVLGMPEAIYMMGMMNYLE